MNYDDNKIVKVIDFIKNLITGTIYEGHVFVVGGCVRDILMEKKPKDIDIAVDTLHGGVTFSLWLAHKTNCYKPNSNPVIYGNYGTAKLNITTNEEISDINIECVETRKEERHDSSRTPITKFGTLEEDAMRRDLTINSMYINVSTGELFDLNGNGVEDLRKHTIRTSNDADIIYGEDPLRMLRTIRFANYYKWGIEKNTWLGLIKNAYKIESIAQERITDEINKILLCDKPSNGIRALYNCGLLGYVLPEIKDLVGVTQNDSHFEDVFGHTLSVLDRVEPILENRLSALFHDIGKLKTRTEYNGQVHFYCHEDVGATIVQDIMKRMKYSNELIKTVATVVKNHMKFKQYKDNRTPSNKVLRKFNAMVGEYMDIALDVIDADNKSHAPSCCMPNQITLIREKYKELEEKGESTPKIKLPINGNDVMEALHIQKSPMIGKYLSVVTEAYLENPNITKEECIDLIKETVFTE